MDRWRSKPLSEIWRPKLLSEHLVVWRLQPASALNLSKPSVRLPLPPSRSQLRPTVQSLLASEVACPPLSEAAVLQLLR